ncbi:MAG: OmpA family protein [Planctomycetota bacterium]
MLAGLMTVASFAAAGCQNAMYDENVALHQQSRQLQDQNRSLRGELQNRPSEAELAAMRSELAERDRMIADLQNRLNAPQPDGLAITGLDDIDISFDSERGEMTMRVPGDVLFASGSTKVNGSADGTLGRIADILKTDYAGKDIHVVGHTDSDPIVKTKNKFADNRDLSMQRAYSVTKALVEKGVDSSRIMSGGMGQYHSLGQGKKKDRRVEIVVVL